MCRRRVTACLSRKPAARLGRRRRHGSGGRLTVRQCSRSEARSGSGGRDLATGGPRFHSVGVNTQCCRRSMRYGSTACLSAGPEGWGATTAAFPYQQLYGRRQHQPPDLDRLDSGEDGASVVQELSDVNDAHGRPSLVPT